jgi:hypothetical protein
MLFPISFIAFYFKVDTNGQQGAGSREQGVGSREQGAGGKN